jgi:hypothetical protein
MHCVFAASGWALFLPRQVPVLSRNGRYHNMTQYEATRCHIPLGQMPCYKVSTPVILDTIAQKARRESRFCATFEFLLILFYRKSLGSHPPPNEPRGLVAPYILRWPTVPGRRNAVRAA